MTFQETQHSPPNGDNSEPDLHRVLIVDDEPAICFAYSKLLKSERFGVDICESIEAAKILLKKIDYFSVISDVRFAGSDNEDGVYLLSVVRKERPQAKVILVTGYGSEELKKTVCSLGASHYFEKPVKPSLLLSVLRALHDEADDREKIEYVTDEERLLLDEARCTPTD